jgi:hypothetical protein
MKPGLRRPAMRQKGFLLATVMLGAFLVRPALANYKVVNGPEDFYFGHVSYAEIKNDGKDPLVFREGQARPETAVLNLPLGPGDTVRTSDSRRCEIQFDNGTIVRLDLNTELKIETILAQSLSSSKKLSNLLLAKGRVYVMYNRYNSRELFQVITPGAAVKLDRNTVVFIAVAGEGETDVQVERGKVNLLYGPDEANLAKKTIRSGQRIVVSADNQVRPEEPVTLSDFRAWNETVNADFKTLHEDNFLPKPVQKLSPAVVDWAERYGYWYGEWLWHDLYGYVWRPTYNDYYPWGGWTPYYYGSWTSYQNQMFWIPNEPWGWVPYHLGLWMWDKNRGWLWIPGSAFAPAWAVWDFYFGSYLWRPMFLFDWYYGSSYLSGYYYGWGGTGYYQPIPPSPGVPAPNILTSIRKDQLKKKDAPPLPLPKEMKKAYKLAVAALERGDERVLSSLRAIPRRSATLRRGDLAQPRMMEKIINLEQFVNGLESLPPSEKMSPAAKQENVARDALRNFQRARILSELKARTVSPPAQAKAPAPAAPTETRFAPGRVAPPSHAVAPEARGSALRSHDFQPGRLSSPAASPSRFRDWNPDIKTASRLGVNISYSSRTNEVRCPQLGLSSTIASHGIRLTGHGVSGTSGAAGGSVSGSSSGSSGSGSGSGSPGSHSSGSSGSRGSSGGSKGGAKKN